MAAMTATQPDSERGAAQPLPTPHAPPPTTHHSPLTHQALIRLDQVSVQFGPQSVLRDISLGVSQDQTVVVIGESGCGKTVLLKLIIGLLRPTRGSVWFDGKLISALNDRELTRQRLRFGFLFQGAALFDSLSVFDNVAF